MTMEPAAPEVITQIVDDLFLPLAGSRPAWPRAEG